MEILILGLVMLAVGIYLIVSSKKTIITKQQGPQTHQPPPRPPQKTQEQFYEEQKERVSIGGYGKQKLLNRTEQTARKAIWKALYDSNNNKKYQLFAQVSLGEVLTHQNKRLYRDINSKRVDFVLVDTDYLPFAVIEIHGQGHYSNEATKRDIIKRQAIESADILYLPIAVGSDEKEIYDAVYQSVLSLTT